MFDGCAKDHQQVQTSVASHARENTERFWAFCAAIPNHEAWNIKHAIEEMQVIRTLGCGFQLAAASMAYRRDIHVLSPAGITVFDVQNPINGPIVLIYIGVTYFSTTTV